jgi:hypothetical protein
MRSALGRELGLEIMPSVSWELLEVASLPDSSISVGILTFSRFRAFQQKPLFQDFRNYRRRRVAEVRDSIVTVSAEDWLWPEGQEGLGISCPEGGFILGNR